MQQTWTDLAFIHWEVDYQQVRQAVPEHLTIDAFDGKAWFGVVPFDMKGVTPRHVPPLSPLSDFPEINVRTYVRHGDKAGVWFFSLDVPNPLAVLVARVCFHLPYFLGQVSVTHRGDTVGYWARYGDRRFEARYRPLPGRRPRQPTAFAQWATERYCLYATDRSGQLFRGDIHHRPWPLEPAEVEIDTNTYLDAWQLGSPHPEVYFSRSIDVVVWPLVRVGPEMPV